MRCVIYKQDMYLIMIVYYFDYLIDFRCEFQDTKDNLNWLCVVIYVELYYERFSLYCIQIQ